MIGSVTAAPSLWGRLRQTTYQLGQCVSPDDAFLGSRGLRTMAVRLARHGESALAVARWLAEQPEVARVLCPALPEAPGHALFRRDFQGGSGLFSIVLRGGDDAARTAMLDGLRYFGLGFSWGGFESLAIPADPEKLRSAVPWSAEGPLVRLHIGLEDPADLIADLRAGLDRFAAVASGR
jgi:cystathionine beta-lyase